jgi:hypothetical protein
MSELQGETAAAVAFLKRLYPKGPWALTSVAIDKKGIETLTFYPASEQDMVGWIDEYNGIRNIYYHINPVRYAVKKKAERTDIDKVCYLHVDIDAIAGKEVATEKQRILGLLTKNRAKGIPEPTIIVSSGGGYQAFWKLSEALPINGEIGLAEEAKRYNQQLETIFGGDHCHNIDRIMRLPGTINVPDEKKLKKGRVAEVARLLQFNDDLVYAIGDFTAAPQVRLQDEVFGGETIYPQAKAQVSGNVRRLPSVDELDEWNVTDRLKVIIVQGHHPDQPKEGDNSRSAWVYDACCNLVRAGVPDDIIYSVITDPDFGISESILEFGASAHKYAIRQIEQAKESAVDPQLRDLNNRYAVISNLGGKCRIVERIEDEALSRSRITKQSFEDFRNSYMHKLVSIGKDSKGNEKYLPMGQWWLSHPQRRQYRTLTFAPGREIKDGYNLWQGFAVNAKPGDCSLFLDHVRRNICNDNGDHYEYLLNWMARAVQYPATPGEVGVALRGAMGVGKSIVAKIFGHLWGPHYMVVTNSSHLVGNFNAHLRDVCFLFADEAFFAGDKKHRSVLRSLITDQLIPLESKGVDVEMGPNYLHIMMASNERHLLPAGEDERRWLVLDVAKGNHQDSKFFGKLMEDMDSGGYEALLHVLLTRDITNFNVRDVPKTEALQEQKLLSLESMEQWWYTKLQHGLILEEHGKWEQEVLKQSLIHDFTEEMRQWNVQRRGNAVQLGRFLAHIVPGLETRQIVKALKTHVGDGIWVDEEPKRHYHYCLPTLEVCRKAWEDKYGPQQWPEPIVSSGDKKEQEIPF